MTWLGDVWPAGLIVAAVVCAWRIRRGRSRRLARRAASGGRRDAAVLILVANQADSIECRLRLWLAHRRWHAPAHPLAIVDLGSDDETPLILARMARQYPGLVCLSLQTSDENIDALGRQLLQSRAFTVIDWRRAGRPAERRGSCA